MGNSVGGRGVPSSAVGNLIGTSSVSRSVRSSAALSTTSTGEADEEYTAAMLYDIAELETENFRIIGVKRDQDPTGPNDMARLHGFVVVKIANESHTKFLRIDWVTTGFWHGVQDTDEFVFLKHEEAVEDVCEHIRAVVEAGQTPVVLEALGFVDADEDAAVDGDANRVGAVADEQVLVLADMNGAVDEQVEVRGSGGDVGPEAQNQRSFLRLLQCLPSVASLTPEAISTHPEAIALESSMEQPQVRAWCQLARAGVGLVAKGVEASARIAHEHADYVEPAGHATLPSLRKFIREIHPKEVDQPVLYCLETRNCNHVANAIFEYLTTGQASQQ